MWPFQNFRFYIRMEVRKFLILTHFWVTRPERTAAVAADNVLTSFVLVRRLWVCSSRNQRCSCGWADTLSVWIRRSHLDAWRRPPVQTVVKSTLGCPILSISPFDPTEGSKEVFYSGSDRTLDDAQSSLCLQGHDAIPDSGDLIGKPAADGRVCGRRRAALAAFLEHGCNQSAGWHTLHRTLPSN